MQLGGPAGIVGDRVLAELDDEFRVGPHQPAVEHVEVHQQVAVLLDQLSQAAQAAFLFQRLEVAPAAIVEGPPGGAHGAIDVLHAPRRAAGEFLAGGRVVDREGLAGGRRNGIAVDDVAEAAVAEERPRRGGQPVVVRGLHQGLGRLHGRVRSKA